MSDSYRHFQTYNSHRTMTVSTTCSTSPTCWSKPAHCPRSIESRPMRSTATGHGSPIQMPRSTDSHPPSTFTTTPPMANNRYVFDAIPRATSTFTKTPASSTTALAYKLPSDVLLRPRLIARAPKAKSKAKGRVSALEPWDEEGTKYTYGKGDGSRKEKLLLCS